jgi:hypothetical protein
MHPFLIHLDGRVERLRAEADRRRLHREVRTGRHVHAPLPSACEEQPRQRRLERRPDPAA